MKGLFQRFFYKKIARQLRKPSGSLGKKVGENMNRSNAFLYEATLEVMQPADHDAVLEIGFGNGKFFNNLFTKASHLQITGIDHAEEMVREAGKNNAASVATGQLQLFHGSSDRLPFADNSFDKVFCINVVYFWDPPASHLMEIYRVLKKGGRFYSVIRSAESIRQMPFARYGFAVYSMDEWADRLRQRRFRLDDIKIFKEPEVTLKGKTYPVESWCFVAAKDI